MKFNRLEYLIIILSILTLINIFESKNNLRREFNFNFEYGKTDFGLSHNSINENRNEVNITNSFNSSSSILEEKVEQSENNWNDGYKLTSFEIRLPGEKEFKNFGIANIYPKKMEEASNLKIEQSNNVLNKNLIGFFFEINSEKLSNIKSLGLFHYLGGENFLIPWRYFVEKPIYENPYLSNKKITLKLKDDKENYFEVRLFFPYSKFSWYISDEQAKKLCNICDEIKNNQINLIKNIKKEIDSTYSYIEANYVKFQTISNLKKSIDENKEKAKLYEKQINEIQIQIDSFEKSINPLVNERKLLLSKYSEYATALDIYKKKIDDINKKDPNMQQNSLKQMKITKEKIKEQVDNLSNLIFDKKDEIDQIKRFAFTFDTKNFEAILKKIGSLELQNK